MHTNGVTNGRGTRRGQLSLALWLTASTVLGCGDVADLALFSRSNAALIQNMGEACDLGALGPNETVVDDRVAACEPGYCVGQYGQAWSGDDQGICTCRCDGPAGTGPLCACGSGYECKELIKNFHGEIDDDLAGSYCVPRR